MNVSKRWDFVAIERWLAGAPVDVPKKEPLPHQQEAIAAIQPTLEQHGCATAVMACGTGKTLVALWVAERSQATTILVLLPSLALVRQTLHEWLHETRWPSLAYLCVCSDPTVTSDVDSLSVTQTDLDFEVNTDSRAVRAFLAADFQGTRLVFCTYQSAHIVAAAMGDGEAFDLGIFDEAHKTAGREGAKFSFALKDENLPIRKRLFLTATPRHYDLHVNGAMSTAARERFQRFSAAYTSRGSRPHADARSAAADVEPSPPAAWTASPARGTRWFNCSWPTRNSTATREFAMTQRSLGLRCCR